MSTTKTRKWKSLGTVPPASNGDPAASAGSYRVFYANAETGEYCYRSASWGDHGTGAHGFRSYGNARGCDEWGTDNGKEYPSAEFA